MLATFMYAPGDVRVESTAFPTLLEPSDVIVAVEAAGVCGSDLWSYRGVAAVERPTAKGHEFVGTVIEVGPDVRTLVPDDFVVSSFVIADGTCIYCRTGIHPSCEKRGRWGHLGADRHVAGGGQAEAVRVPLADGTLFRTERPHSLETTKDLLALADVMSTGHHAAVCAEVRAGATAVVVGDGAVGQCAVIAARRLGAERVIMMSRHPGRQHLARSLGATDIVPERGKEGAAVIKEITAGVGADCVLECVGTDESFAQAISSTRPGGRVGFVGLPAGAPSIAVSGLFARNVGIRGGGAPVQAYIGDLLTDVRAGLITPGRVFDSILPLDRGADAYRAMASRTSIKAMLFPQAAPDLT